MTTGGELEPEDSRNVTGAASTPDGHWSGDAPQEGNGGEFEPKDSRNVTGAATTEDGRWTGAAARPNEEPEDRKAKD